MMLESISQLGFIGPGGPEFLVVMLVLLLMFGAKDAPRIFRKINEMINSMRSTADGFKREIMYGDLNSASSSSEDEDPYGVDGEYYDGEDQYDEDSGLTDEDVERDYSDETFQNLEQDLERTETEDGEIIADEEPSDADETPNHEEADDARKT